MFLLLTANRQQSSWNFKSVTALWDVCMSVGLHSKPNKKGIRASRKLQHPFLAMLFSEKGGFYSVSFTYSTEDYQMFSWEMFSYFCTWGSPKIYVPPWSLPSACRIQSMTLLFLIHSCCWQSIQPGQGKRSSGNCAIICNEKPNKEFIV